MSHPASARQCKDTTYASRAALLSITSPWEEVSDCSRRRPFLPPDQLLYISLRVLSGEAHTCQTLVSNYAGPKGCVQSARQVAHNNLKYIAVSSPACECSGPATYAVRRSEICTSPHETCRLKTHCHRQYALRLHATGRQRCGLQVPHCQVQLQDQKIVPSFAWSKVPKDEGEALANMPFVHELVHCIYFSRKLIASRA